MTIQEIVKALEKARETNDESFKVVEEAIEAHAEAVSRVRNLKELDGLGSEEELSKLSAHGRRPLQKQHDKLIEEAEREAGGYFREVMLATETWYRQKNTERQSQSAIYFSEKYAAYTSQEMDALARAIADGRSAANFMVDEQALTLTHQTPERDAFFVQLRLTAGERTVGLGLDYLEELSAKQDADGIFVLYSVLSALVPAPSEPFEGYAGGWVDLDEIAKAIGWTSRTRNERLTQREHIYDYLQFISKARIIGQRNYKVKDDDEVINTQIETPVWTFGGTERPVGQSNPNDSEQLKLIDDAYAIPVKQEIIISREWTSLLRNPKTAQYLPLGEKIGGIPSNQPGGSWARSIGLALMNRWRRNPQGALKVVGAKEWKISRRELLTHYTPKVSPPDEILFGKNPQRARTYWRDALRILVERSILADDGEAKMNLEEAAKKLPRYNWQDFWLDEIVDIVPGKEIQGILLESSRAPIARKVAELRIKPKRGRPKKVPAG